MKRSRISGIALAALGIAVFAGAFLLSDDFTPALGLRWNLDHMRLVLMDEVEESAMDILAFRESYPEYADMDGLELATRLHARYFSDMPKEEYFELFLGGSPRTYGSGESGGDPVAIRGELSDIRPFNQLVRAIMTSDAIEYGLLTLTRKTIAFPARWAAFAGLGLTAVGVLLIIRGSNKQR